LGGAAASVPNGGIDGSVAPIIIITPFAAGYFLGARAVLAATFATVAAFIFLYWAGSAGLVTPTPYPPEATKLQALFLLSMATVLGAIAVYAFAREATAREAELEHTNQVLNRERDLLEVRVLERTAALEAASQRAEAASKAKTQFLATMSHELRTPLSSIKSYAELLREGAEEESRNADIDDLDVILGASDHLLGLISEVLNMSKIEAGRMELDISAFDLGQLVETLTRSVRPIVKKNANSFCVAADPDLGEVRTDKVKLNQCLLNLLSNAAKFTKRGTVTLSIAAFERGNGPWIAFAVSDTGIGMSPDQLRKLFKPFSQADASTTRQYGGTGLGLSISKAFAELLGGSLEVESAKGKGTTFRLLIPAKLQAQERAKDEPIQSNADIKKGVAA
jgi:signal transduction histidine kinase